MAQLSEQLLGRYDLRVYQDDVNLWWIGTEQAYQDRVAFVFIKLEPELISRSDELLMEIASSFNLAPQQLPAVIDRASSSLILRMPRGIASEVGSVLTKLSSKQGS